MGSRLKKNLKALANMAVAVRQCYRLKISVDGTDPLVWRTVQLDGNFTLNLLHGMILDVLDWADEKVHLFTVRGKTYVDPEQLGDKMPNAWDENSISLFMFGFRKGERFTYKYGEWDFAIEVEDVRQIEPDRYDMLIDGAGACPPQDCENAAAYAGMKKKFDPAVWQDREVQIEEWADDAPQLVQVGKRGVR